MAELAYALVGVFGVNERRNGLNYVLLSPGQSESKCQYAGM